MDKIWTTDEEAAHLRQRFDALKAKGMKQAVFAREHKIKGGASMLNQHLKGHRPISQEAAIAYATAFKCPLSEISPRIAADLKKAVASTPLLAAVTGGIPGPTPLTLSQALEMLGGRIEMLSPVLHGPAKDLVAKWAHGEASLQETAATLDAFAHASKSLPTAPALAETPIKVQRDN